MLALVSVGFSVKLAPGVRVRASSRGLRTSIGPRAARLHVGTGRTGISTGVGPVSFYSSLGGTASRSGGSGSRGPSASALSAAMKAQQAQELAGVLLRILDLHRADYQPAAPPVAPLPPTPDAAAIRDRHVRSATTGLGLLALRARGEAKARAEVTARAEIAAIEADNERRRNEVQAHLDELWARLLANDPDVVLGTLAEAFEDNEAPAAAVGIEGGEVSLVVLVPAATELPERKPDITPAGNLTLKRLTKREAAELYREMVCGYVLATVKEAFAVAPGLTGANVVAVRRTEKDAYGRARIDALLAAHLARPALHGIQWAHADAMAITRDASDTLKMRLIGPSKDLAPLDLTTDPDIARLIASFDQEEPADPPRQADGR